MLDKHYYIYIATNYPRKSVLYTGVTGKLIKRSGQHKEKFYYNSFTARYNVNRIVYYEIYDNVRRAIYREKQIKNLVRRKKIDLIVSVNPKWNDILKDV